MSTAVTIGVLEASPRFKARMAGVFYLLTLLTGVVAVPSFRLIVDSNAAATAVNVLAHEAIFRLGFTALLINVTVYIAVTLLFYELCERVNRSLCCLAAFCSLAGCAIQAVSSAFFLAPLVVLGSAQSLSAFNVEQLQAQALMFFKLYGQAYQHRPGIFRILLSADRLPHREVDLSASSSGRADGVCGFGLADLSVAAAGKPSFPIQSGRRRPRGRVADAVAPREGRERSTMERTVKRSGGVRWTLDSIIRVRRNEYERSSNDATYCRSVAAFHGQDCRCPFFAQHSRGSIPRVLRSQVGIRRGPHRGPVHGRCDAASLLHL